MNQVIDLDFRPRTYLGPHRLEQHMLSQVKGAVAVLCAAGLASSGRWLLRWASS